MFSVNYGFLILGNIDTPHTRTHAPLILPLSLNKWPNLTKRKQEVSLALQSSLIIEVNCRLHWPSLRNSVGILTPRWPLRYLLNSSHELERVGVKDRRVDPVCRGWRVLPTLLICSVEDLQGSCADRPTRPRENRFPRRRCVDGVLGV